MKKMDRMTLQIFIFGLPVVIVMALFARCLEGRNSLSTSGWEAYHTLSGIIFGVWMLLSLYFSARLLCSANFRAETLPRLSFFKERDEREVSITAKATRNSFLTSLALLILLFCISVFQVEVYRVAPEKSTNGKTGTIALGLNLNFLNKPSDKPKEMVKEYFRYTGLPASNSSLILIMIFWQIGSFNYFKKRAYGFNHGPS